MCGIIGVVAKSPVNQLLYDGLLVLQHRGQDAAGIVTADESTFHMHKGSGFVRDVFRTRNMRTLMGSAGIAHCRYPTAGSAENSAESQPLYVNSPFGIVLGHNGNLTNSEQLKRELFRQDRRHVNTNSDSEVLLNVLAHELQEASSSYALDPATIFQAVSGVHRRCRGAYAVVAMIAGYGLLAFRDPYGIRPLVVGCTQTEHGHRLSGRLGECGARRAGLHAGARRGAGRGHLRRPGRQLLQPAVRAQRLAQPLHLRVRLSRAARFGDRRHLRVRHAPAHGREPGGEDPPRACRPRHRRGDPDPRLQPAGRRRAGQAAGRELPGRLHQEPLHRPHLHHARDRRSARNPCARSSTPSAGSSRARTCCWWTTPSCAAPPAARSCRWRAKRGRTRCSSPRPRRPCASPMSTASTCRRPSELIATGRTHEEIAREIGADCLIYQDLDALVNAVRSVNPKVRASRRRASAASTSPATSRPSIWPASRPSATTSRWNAAPPSPPPSSI